MAEVTKLLAVRALCEDFVSGRNDGEKMSNEKTSLHDIWTYGAEVSQEMGREATSYLDGLWAYLHYTDPLTFPQTLRSKQCNLPSR